MDDGDQRRTLVALGYATCACDRGLDHGHKGMACGLCASPFSAGTVSVTHHADTSALKRQLREALAALLDAGVVDRPGSRVTAMQAVQRTVLHATDEAYLDLDRSSAGIFCLKGLRSSLRELRVSAG